ncbi:hypothetical protein KZ483_24055 [Paenibacillus sp. sptzw28]|uniref:hypothetical protein n=1 Tax=Paenibacillus sp. sptzw28 TaxID=715179 RepID=UPI001C6F4C29|nr:hypothetical protein [Paenibacillus sp. sptzw28]QYR20797.1 hypothetical protein KZ483_24055 [Paenibacillus sp. sptzw28]
MYNTTQTFKDNIYASSRRIAGRVTFDISDVGATSDVSSITTTTEAASISDKSQINDNKRSSTYNFATWETGRFKLDGSFSFPDSAPANNGQMGFVSSPLCDGSGTFATQPTITIDFNSTHSSAGLTITFDQNTGEYATDFDVTAYNASGGVIQTVSVTGNTQIIATPLGQLSNYKKIVIVIKKWSVSNRRARVLEVDFGIVKVYTDDQLIEMGLIEEMDPLSAQLPSPEFRFMVDNSDRAFNILNPTGFYAYLQQRQQVIAELGVDVNGTVQWVPLGNYLLWEWQSDEGSLTASFKARTNLDLMDNFEYQQATANVKTLYQLAVDNFAACGITNYSIDTALQSINTNSISDNVTRRQLLQMIAIAGCANIYVTRSNVITIKQLPNLLGTAVDTIDLDNAYNEPQITLDPVVRQVVVSYWTSATASTPVTVTDPNLLDGSVLKLEQNKLLDTITRAQAVAQWLLDRSKLRAKYRSIWRGNPAHELADVLGFENTYGADKTAMDTKNDISYKGYLSANTEAKGATG